MSTVVSIAYQDIVPDGRLVAMRDTADVGELITFQIVDTTMNTVRFLVDFHDTSEILDLGSQREFTHAFFFEGIYNITMVMVSIAGLTKTVNEPVIIKNQQPRVEIEINGPRLMDENLTLSIKGNISTCDTSNDIGRLTFT